MNRPFAKIALTLAVIAVATPAPPAFVDDGEPIVFGRTEDLHSEVLGETRTFRIAAPSSYEGTTREYPVLLVLDGEGPAFLTATAASQFLSRLGLAPEMLVVALHNTQRERDMTPDHMELPGVVDPRADTFLEFLGSELFPYLEDRYRAQPFRVLIGHSHGGLLGTYALSARPDLFRWHLAIDAPIHLESGNVANALIEFLGTHPEHRGRLVCADNALGWPDAAWAELERAAPPGFCAERLVFADESHESIAFEATYEGLKRLFAGFRRDELDAKSFEQLSSECRALSAEYGFEVVPSLRTLSIHAEEQLGLGQGRLARELLEAAVALHGAFPRSEQRIEAARELEQRGPPRDTVADIEARPRASAAEMAPYLGTWKGYSGGQGMIVRFWLEEERVEGSTEFIRPEQRGQGLVLEHAVIEITDAGVLGFGYVNNKRPRGVLYYLAELADDGALRGSLQLLGVDFEMPEGGNFEFEFHRVDDATVLSRN